MAKSREINMDLPSADDLFTTQEERDQKNQEYVKNISIYEITDFPNHPFKVKTVSYTHLDVYKRQMFPDNAVEYFVS